MGGILNRAATPRRMQQEVARWPRVVARRCSPGRRPQRSPFNCEWGDGLVLPNDRGDVGCDALWLDGRGGRATRGG